MPTIQYVIQRGDTLHVIAKRFGVAAADIAKANSIENVNRITVGDELSIDVSEQVAATYEGDPDGDPDSDSTPAEGEESSSEGASEDAGAGASDEASEDTSADDDASDDASGAASDDADAGASDEASGATVDLPDGTQVSAADLPEFDSFNDAVLYAIEHYPRGGSYDKAWSGNGVIRDLPHPEGGTFIPRKGSGTYCVGITMDALTLSWQLYCAQRGQPYSIGGLDKGALRKLWNDWYIADHAPERRDEQGPAGLVAAGIGEEVGQDDLQPGDFVQIWRKPGVASGHSVIFKGWDGEKIQYWSSQGSTDGIAEHEENASNFDALVCARVTPEF